MSFLDPSNGNNLALVVNDNAHGLSRDARLLESELTRLGWNVTTKGPKTRTWFDRLFRKRQFDVVIHLEMYHRMWIGAGKKQVLIPNPEWYRVRLIKKLKHFDFIFTKTKHATEIFSKHHDSVKYIGFESRDRYDGRYQKNWNRFFHLAGASFLKGTETVLSLWDRHPEWPELVLIQRHEGVRKNIPDNVTLITDHMDENTLIELQNTCGIHLCPSRAEGWGHYLVEAMSCGAVIVTTDAPPMNEFIDRSNGVSVPYYKSESRKMGRCYFVDEIKLEVEIISVLKLSDLDKSALGTSARMKFDTYGREFSERISRVFSAQ